MKYVYLFLLLIITLPAMANNKVSGEDIVQKATQYSGIRYTPGGSNPKRGFDCSGFVSYVFRKLDISVPRSSASLFCKDKQVSDYKDLHLGDLVFFSGSRISNKIGHVGIVVSVNNETGEFSFIHAARQGVTVSSSTEDYYSKRLLYACRSPHKCNSDTPLRFYPAARINNGMSMITMTHGNIRSVIRNKLTQRLSADDIHEICFYTQGERNNSHKEELYACIKDGDEKVSYNALWVFTHFDPYNFQWLAPRQDELISLALQETHEGKKRLLLTLILRLPFREDELRTDFIDYCLSGITSCENSCGVRALCIKLSYEQCKFHTDLLSELENILSLLDNEPLSSGLAIARKNILKKILNRKASA